MFTLSIKSNVAEVSRALDRYQREQLPYATALALTDLGKQVRDAERAEILKVFPTATPFTVASVGTRGATKARLEARVFVKDIAAKYLEPFAFGGHHFLSAMAILYPKDVRLNQYGNIPMRTLARLKGRKDIFIGGVMTKHGKVNGVWQRVTVGLRSRSMRGVKSFGGSLKGPTSHLKLLIRFGDSLEVRQHLSYFDVAKQIVESGVNAAFGRALTRALATSR